MFDIISKYFIILLNDPFSPELWALISFFIPFVIFLELPFYIFVLAGILKYHVRKNKGIMLRSPYFPTVTCIITCYSEEKAAADTVRCLAEQIYDGFIEIIPVVDGASVNRTTYDAVKSMENYVHGIKGRKLVVLPKWQRGGRVSSLNSGLAIAHGEIIMALDGDTSFDNDMVEKATRHFEDERVVGVAGALRISNVNKNMLTKIQALEYLLSIHASKTGLNEFNAVNNISGAFGVFRKKFLDMVSGWSTGTAEDLDMTLRIKNYFGRYKDIRIVFDPEAIGHTEAPDTLKGLFKQRLRWDGDLFFLYFRKHPKTFNRRLMGFKNYILQVWTGLMFQIFTPILIIAYTSYMCFALTAQKFIFLFALIYLFYLFIASVFYFTFVLLISERSEEDLKLLPILPLFALYMFFARFMNGFAVIWEMAAKSHLDSSMAPWWVLKKPKF